MSDYIPKAHELPILYRLNRPYLRLSGHGSGPVPCLPLWGGQPAPGRIGNLPLRERGDGAQYYCNIRDLFVQDASEFSLPDFRRFRKKEVGKLHGEMAFAFARGLTSCAVLLDKNGDGQYLRVAKTQGGSLVMKFKGNPGRNLQTSDVVVTSLAFLNEVYEAKLTSNTSVPQEVKKMLESWLFDHILTPLLYATFSSKEVSYRDPHDEEKKPLLFHDEDQQGGQGYSRNWSYRI